MNYHFVESTLDITYQTRTVRVWVEKRSTKLHEAVLQRIIKDIRVMLLDSMHDEEILSQVAKFPSVTAVQVLGVELDFAGQQVKRGTVVYTVPFEDLKG